MRESEFHPTQSAPPTVLSSCPECAAELAVLRVIGGRAGVRILDHALHQLRRDPSGYRQAGAVAAHGLVPQAALFGRPFVIAHVSWSLRNAKSSSQERPSRVSKDGQRPICPSAARRECLRDGALGVVLDLPQVLLAAKALRIDLVDILGARRPRREPSAV